MCEFGFGWPGLDTISLYNAGLRWFAIGALGVGVPAKVVAMWRVWDGDRRRWMLASVALIASFGGLIVWFPSHALVWGLLREITCGYMEWCGWLLLVSAGVATALDAAVLRFGFRQRPSRPLFVANLAGLAAGYAVAIWYDVRHPAIA